MERKHGTIQKAFTAFVLAVLLFLCAGILLTATSARAEGGPTYRPQDNTKAVEVVMNVNGRASVQAEWDNYNVTEYNDLTRNKMQANNALQLRTRRISLGSLLAEYAYINEVPDADKALYRDSYFMLVNGSLDNQYTTYVGAAFEDAYLVLTAIQYKSAASPAQISFTLKRNGDGAAFGDRIPAELTVYVRVTVGSSFVFMTNENILNLNGIDDNHTLYIKDDTPIELKNGDIKTYDVAELVGKPFFYLAGGSKEETDLREQENGQSWQLYDANRVSVTSVIGINAGNYKSNSQPSIVGSEHCVIASIDSNYFGTATPRIMVTVEFTEAAVQDVDRVMGTDAFWNSTHYLYFNLRDSNGVNVRIAKAVRFSTAGEPQKKQTPDIITDLNASSDNVYKVGSSENNDLAAEGFGSVWVLPSHIVEYPSTSVQTLSFGESMEPAVDNNVVTCEFLLNGYPIYGEDKTIVGYEPVWVVKANQRGTAIVTFRMQYAGLSVIDIPVSFEVYGNYNLSIATLQGKKSQSYKTTTANEFAEITRDGYTMTGVEVIKGADYATADLASGVLTLRPLADGTTTLRFTFANLSGRTITVDTDVRMDYTAKGFFVVLEDWQAWLIIAAAIVVGIGLILLIVWLFIRSVSKRREEELQTTAPTSSYIIKLNSTIAATQAQQKAATQAFSAAQTQMLQLGSTTTGTTTQPINALQLGAAPAEGVNTTTKENDSYPKTADKPVTPPPADEEEIYIPISDEELLERIFVEKYEPHGMVRRTFFKSKDLQSRELEKEKARIRDLVRNGTPIEEAIKSQSELEKTTSATVAETPEEEVKEAVTVESLLGFDPKSPLLPEEEPVAPAEDAAPEEVRLQEAERRLNRLEAEYGVICERQTKAVEVTDAKTAEADEDEKTIVGKREYADTLKEDVTQLEIKLATARSKEKEKINKDIEGKERIQKDTVAAADKLAAELEEKRVLLGQLEAVRDQLGADKSTWEQSIEEAKTTLEDAKKDHELYLERVEMAKKAQAKRESIDELSPMLVTVNTLDKELRDLENLIDKDSKDKDTFKTEVNTIQAQLLTTNDVNIIANLSARINDLNKASSNLDKEISSNKKLQSDKNIQFTKERKRANEYIEKKELTIEDVIAAEDEVIGQMALDESLKTTQAEQAQAEEDVTKYQAMVDEFLEMGDSKVLELAVKTSEDIKAAEEEASAAEAELNDLTARMETASDDEKLMMSIDQMSLTERVEELKAHLEEVTAQATKEKLEFQMNRDQELEALRAQLTEAQETYAKATDRINDLTNNVKPTDLIISGSGVISQDQQILERENLKKQLQQTKDILEQANIQAKVAQMEAERKIIEAQKASDASKEEAERAAQEAIAAAEEAKREAEERAEEESNRVREEAERAMREAEEAAERARREAEEEAERLRQEAEAAREEAERAKREAEEAAEQARREAEEAAEQAKREAEEAAERARKEAEEEAERARKEAEEAAEKAKREAEEAAEQARREAEEAAEQAKREAEEAAERARKEAEEEAERTRKEAEEAAEKERIAAEQERKEKEEREARIAEKVAKRKQKILELRNELKTVTDEQSAKALREKFYAEQMALDEDEKTSDELKDLINKSMDDATHAGELAVYKALANKAPRRIVKKVTERVNRVPRKKSGARPNGARPNGARPASRSAGARPNGARPASRPAGARPNGARPASRPAGARPNGARPASRPSARPNGGAPRRPSGK